MESNLEIDVENNVKINRCPLGQALNPNLAKELGENLSSTIKPNQRLEHSSRQPLNASLEPSLDLSLGKRSKVMLLKITGILFVGLAMLGVALPILPTTPFLLVAAACFAKSSPTMQKKLLANKTFGPLIHDWQKYRSIPKKAKRIALLTMILSVCWSAFMLQNLWLTLFVVALVTGPFIFLWRLPITR